MASGEYSCEHIRGGVGGKVENDPYTFFYYKLKFLFPNLKVIYESLQRLGENIDHIMLALACFLGSW